MWERSGRAWSDSKIPGGGAPEISPQRYRGFARAKGLGSQGWAWLSHSQAPPVMGLLWSCSFSSTSISGKQEEAQG